MLPFRGESRGVKRKNDYYYIIKPGIFQRKSEETRHQKNSIVKCNNFLLIFLYILFHHNKAVNIHSFVGSLL